MNLFTERNLRTFEDTGAAHVLDQEWNELPLCSTCKQGEAALMKTCSGTALTVRESRLVYAIYCQKPDCSLTTIEDYNRAVVAVREFERNRTLLRIGKLEERGRIEAPAVEVVPWAKAGNDLRSPHPHPIQVGPPNIGPETAVQLSLEQTSDLVTQLEEVLRLLNEAYTELQHVFYRSPENSDHRIKLDPFVFEDGGFGFQEKPVQWTLGDHTYSMGAYAADAFCQNLSEAVQTLDIEYHPKKYRMDETEIALMRRQQEEDEKRESERIDTWVENDLNNYLAAYEKLQRERPDASREEIVVLLRERRRAAESSRAHEGPKMRS